MALFKEMLSKGDTMKRILITGATDGIGLETAKSFAKQGYSLILHGRNAQKLEEIKKIFLQNNSSLEIDLYQADFSNLKAVHKMAEKLVSDGKVIDVLINNAGIYTLPEEESITNDNLDIRFEVNTIAPYILTNKILPLLAKDGRVINLASAAQAPVDFNALQNKDMLMPLDADMAYAQSKLALMMWTMEMAEEAKKFSSERVFVSVNPKSFLGSKMVRQAYGRQGFNLKIGADILYDAALSEEFKYANGMYFDNDYASFSNPHPFAQDKAKRTILIKILDTYL